MTKGSEECVEEFSITTTGSGAGVEGSGEGVKGSEEGVEGSGEGVEGSGEGAKNSGKDVEELVMLKMEASSSTTLIVSS